MKIAMSFLAALLLATSVGAGTSFATANGVLSDTMLTPGDYCHLKFPAILEQTLSGDRPVLKDASTGDVIDFYGPCETNPVGESQIAAQKYQSQYRQRQREE
ncbi:MAG TPA: hypothetical protein VE131_14215 [Terriglobales bacterium]|nr:hypothetical protein [Terriglobales bacterium]